MPRDHATSPAPYAPCPKERAIAASLTYLQTERPIRRILSSADILTLRPVSPTVLRRPISEHKPPAPKLAPTETPGYLALLALRTEAKRNVSAKVIAALSEAPDGMNISKLMALTGIGRRSVMVAIRKNPDITTTQENRPNQSSHMVARLNTKD